MVRAPATSHPIDATIAILLLLGVGGATPPVFARDKLAAKIEKLVAEGDRLRAHSNHTGAFEKYAEANRLAEGKSFEPLERLAKANFRIGRYETTIRLASEARALTDVPTTQAELAYLVGRSYFDSAHLLPPEHEDWAVKPERWDQSMELAESFLLHATATAPMAVPEARYLLGRIYEGREDLDRAERFYEDYLALAPKGDCAAMARYRLEDLRKPVEESVDEEAVEMQPPVKLASPQPTYTLEARNAHIQGTVVVVAIVDKAGEIGFTKLLHDLPGGLGQSALAAVRHWRFEPARLSNGHRVAVFYTLTVVFQLGDLDEDAVVLPELRVRDGGH